MANPYSTVLVPMLALLVSACAAESPLAPAAVPVDLTAPTNLTLDAAIGQGSAAGHATVTAHVLNAVGAKLAGVPVHFSTDVGTLAPSEALTDADGLATTAITASRTATVTVTAGSITTRTLVPSEPTGPGVPPPSVAPIEPPVPVPTPPPPPPPPLPALTVTLTTTALSVMVGNPLTFTATVTSRAIGETITAYQWDLDGNGTYEFTSTAPTHDSAPYLTGGVFTAKLLVLTSLNRQASATVGIVVTN